MIIKKIIVNPFRKQIVKNLPKDAEYKQQGVNGNKVYFSKSKQCHYEVVE